MKIQVMPYEHLELEEHRGRFGKLYTNPPLGFTEQQNKIMWALFNEAKRDFGDKIFVETNIFRSVVLKIEVTLERLDASLIDWLLEFLAEIAPDRYIFGLVIDEDSRKFDIRNTIAWAFALNLKEIVIETDLYPHWEKRVGKLAVPGNDIP
jgi:hypothetical protein